MPSLKSKSTQFYGDNSTLPVFPLPRIFFLRQFTITLNEIAFLGNLFDAEECCLSENCGALRKGHLCQQSQVLKFSLLVLTDGFTEKENIFYRLKSQVALYLLHWFLIVTYLLSILAGINMTLKLCFS